MADSYELLLDVDLGPGLTSDELAELRWHLGQTPLPERLVLGTDAFRAAYPLGDPSDPDCEWDIADPDPLFAGRGAAHSIGGELSAGLVAREPAGWTLTARQELHPDLFDPLRAFLGWLGPRAIGADEAVGSLRWYEDTAAEPLVINGGVITIPPSIAEHTEDQEG
ncbi:hypothetical protein [Microlunatus sp. GCM10028923]|uniref:hypothetical protein n=1 Tax=Microlunatus sp. GCM10028923 TaxID=3273400 RepID=UPI0036212EA8